MSRSAAQRKLSAEFTTRAARPLVITASGERTTMSPRRIGLSVDVPATVERTGAGRSWSPRRLWNYHFGGSDIDAVLSVDEAALDGAISRFADRGDVHAEEGKVRFRKGCAVPSYPHIGKLVERARAATVVRAAFVSKDLPTVGVELPMRTVKPEVSRSAITRSMNQFATLAMSGPVSVRIGPDKVLIQPDKFSAALSMRARGGELRPGLNEKALVDALNPLMRTIGLAPQDASVTIKDGKPKVVPGKTGVSVDPKNLSPAFLRALTRTGTARTVTPQDGASPATVQH
jgi:hypothetical protein